MVIYSTRNKTGQNGFFLAKCIKKFVKIFLSFFRKPIDICHFCAIILYCIIIAIIMGVFCPFFRTPLEKLGEIYIISIVFLVIFHN